MLDVKSLEEGMTMSDQELGHSVAKAWRKGLEKLRQPTNPDIAGSLRWLVQELDNLQPQETKLRVDGVGEASVGDEEAPTSPEDSLVPNVNVTACECDKLKCEVCTAKTLHCDEIEDMEERVYCVEDTKRIVLPPCNFLTKEGQAMAAMELDEEFTKKTMEAKHEEQQERIEAAVEAAHTVADVNGNGSIEPSELHSLVSALAPIMQDVAQIGKCTPSHALSLL